MEKLGERVSTFLATDGDGYELQMGRWSRRLAPLLVEFAGVVEANRVLDVGCGTGNLCLCLARNPAIGRVFGIDLSPAYVEHANRAKDSRLSFEVGDACALPFADAWRCWRCNLNRIPTVPCAKCAE